ncbi:MAG: FAD-dependent oxidoreductase, partial [Deltaproteobacteria bacterium]|nr:FAD-dependent oxidoreductase [Deltaproteobacteria bacterium]
MDVTNVTVLGAGPAGLAAALELAESGVNVTVVEKQDHVG